MTDRNRADAGRCFLPSICRDPLSEFARHQGQAKMSGMEREFIYPAAATAVALLGAGFDIKSRRIPNVLTGPAMLLGLALHAGLDGWRGGLNALSAGLICGIIFLVFYL